MAGTVVGAAKLLVLATPPRCGGKSRGCRRFAASGRCSWGGGVWHSPCPGMARTGTGTMRPPGGHGPPEGLAAEPEAELLMEDEEGRQSLGLDVLAVAADAEAVAAECGEANILLLLSSLADVEGGIRPGLPIMDSRSPSVVVEPILLPPSSSSSEPLLSPSSSPARYRIHFFFLLKIKRAEMFTNNKLENP